MAATSTVCAGAAVAEDELAADPLLPAEAPPLVEALLVAAPPLAGVAVALDAEDRAHDFPENTHRLLPIQ